MLQEKQVKIQTYVTHDGDEEHIVHENMQFCRIQQVFVVGTF